MYTESTHEMSKLSKRSDIVNIRTFFDSGKKSTTPKKVKSEKKKGPDRNLQPNPKIKILDKDPFFETRYN